MQSLLASDLTSALIFYGSYHNNKWNKIIHFFFVPLIWWTFVVFCCYLPISPAAIPALGLRDVNASLLVFLVYAHYYVYLDRAAGVSCAVALLAGFLGANQFYVADPHSAWKYALVLHALGWYMQIHPGHAICEGRRPALLDSFVQSLVTAPFFVWFETLFVLGFYASLHDKVQQGIDKELAALKKSKQ